MSFVPHMEKVVHVSLYFHTESAHNLAGTVTIIPSPCKHSPDTLGVLVAQPSDVSRQVLHPRPLLQVLNCYRQLLVYL